VLKLCRAAGRRLDLLQLPRSGFGQLALVPLAYTLLLLWIFLGYPLLVEGGAAPEAFAELPPTATFALASPPVLEASLYPWNDTPRRLPMRGPLGTLQHAY
jgi:hypothetical protein